MHKMILSAFLCAVMVTLALPSNAQPYGPGPRYGRCPRHQYWVPPHRNRHGHWVRGRCAWR